MYKKGKEYFLLFAFFIALYQQKLIWIIH